MPDMYTDGDQGPINQVILSNIGPVTDDQGGLIDGSGKLYTAFKN